MQIILQQNIWNLKKNKFYKYYKKTVFLFTPPLSVYFLVKACTHNYKCSLNNFGSVQQKITNILFQNLWFFIKII